MWLGVLITTGGKGWGGVEIVGIDDWGDWGGGGGEGIGVVRHGVGIVIVVVWSAENNIGVVMTTVMEIVEVLDRGGEGWGCKWGSGGSSGC